MQYIIPVDRQRKRFATLRGLYAVQNALAAEYRAHAQPDWDTQEAWVLVATRQLLDIAVRDTARINGTIGTVDQKDLPGGVSLIFVDASLDWLRLGRQVCPAAELCHD